MNEQKPLLPDNTAVEMAGAVRNRRQFLGIAGALAGAGLIGLASCKKDSDQPFYENDGLNLGSGDAGVVNYVYALKQITAAFYQQVVASSASVFPAKELTRLKEIAAHETIHSRFLRAWMTQQGITPLQDLGANFSTINFGDRTSVLQVAKTLEDMSVAAINGAGKLLKSAQYLLMVGKMASVDARHAAFVRDLLAEGSFADLIALADLGADDAKGLDGALAPPQVISQIGKYIRQRLDASRLPSY